jgi:WD40 repeat protein
MSCDEEIAEREIRACESLDRFKELHFELDSAKKIMSRYPVSLGGEDKFVHDFAGTLAGGSREARLIYRTAADISIKAALIWANIKDSVDPHYNQVIFNNLPENFLNKLKSIPAYDRLFGSLDYVNCNSCRSIFGPAAYFVDLMRFVQTYIVDANSKTIPEDCALGYRRPDLAKIRLNCSNSMDMVPAIDLVNELLKDFLETTGEYSDAYEVAKEAIFPQSLPFNSPREEVLSYLNAYESSLWQIYQAFNRPFADTLFANTIEGHIARELLPLSPDDFRLISSEISSRDICEYYGGVDLAGIDGLENVDVLLEKTKLTREELNDLISLNLDRHEVNAGLSRLLFINGADDGLGTLAISPDEGIGYDRLQNLSYRKLERLYRFLKLSRKLNWSFSDLDWSLRSLCAPYLPEKALKFDGIDDYISCPNANKLNLFSLPEFSMEAWINLDSTGSRPVVGLLISRTVEQHHIYLGVNPLGKLVFCVFQIYDGQGDVAESRNIIEVQSNEIVTAGVFTHVAVSAADGYVFGWDKVPGDDKEGFIRFLVRNFGIDWVKDAEIAKLDDKTIKVSAEKNLLYLKLNDEKTKAILEIDGVERDEFPARTENNELKIYADGRVSLFINGKKDIEESFSKPAVNSPISGIDMNIGRDLFDNYFDGIIKEVRIWKKTFAEAALDGNRYQRFTGRENDLLGYWPLLESSWNYLPDLTDMPDLVPRGSNGILGGGEFSAQPNWVYQELILDPLPDAGDGSYLRFNGEDEYLAARGFVMAEMDQITIEATVKVEDRGTSRWDDCILCLGEDGQNPKVALYSSAEGKLVFKLCPQPEPSYNPIILTSSASLPLNETTHVCAVFDKNTVKFYINGAECDLIATQSVSIMIENGFLNVGRSFDGENGGNYFCGMIKELRIYSSVRTAGEINSYLYRHVPASSADLVGYWRLDEVEEGKAGDHSEYKNDLYLGGILDDYAPVLSTTEILPRSEELPVPASGSVLQFDGDNDVIVIKNSKNWGLGRYERLTLELWFNASNHGDIRRKQVLFSQGDAEAGLCIYLYSGSLFVLEWNNSLENIAQNIPPESKSRSLFTMPFTDYGHWHHIAVTQNEFPSDVFEKTAFPVNDCFYKAEDCELRAYLDGKPLSNEYGNEVSSGYKLSPVGPIYLGGLGRDGKTCFAGGYSNKDNVYFFAGQIANLGIYNLVKSEDEIGGCRYFAPAITKDLITYLPMDEGEGWYVRGWESENQHIGTLQDRNIGLVCQQSDAELINIYSHYSGLDALSWSNYYFSGRMRIEEINAPIGITFYSRHLEGVDQCYILGRDADKKTFHLFAHPSGVQEVKSSSTLVDMRDTGIIPQVNVWYNFLVIVESSAAQTNIKAKIWLEGGVMPDAYQIDAYDDRSTHISSGTVGLWTTGLVASKREFDNLKVWPATIVEPMPSDFLLDINFEAESQIPEPDNWLDEEDRQKLPTSDVLFKQIAVIGGTAGETAFGTNSEDLNIHSYFSSLGSDALNWKNYLIEGMMRISDANSGIGITFLSRQPEGIDQYYGLVRDDNHSTFHLVAHPQGVQKVKSSDLVIDRTDSGIEPLPNVWYNFLIEIYDTGTETKIKAKIWPESVVIPSQYAIDAYDDSDIRIRAGTAGVWATGAGSKYFRHLNIYRDVKLYESFRGYTSGQDPTNWRDTKANSSNIEDNSLFKTFTVDGRTVFGTKSQSNNIHTHYVGSGSIDWKNYTIVGCIRIGDASDTQFGNAGVTVLSHYFSNQSNYNRYYKLTNLSESDNGFVLLNASNDPLKGTYKSNLIPLAKTWYRFIIEVEDTGSRTNIRAKIWPESGTEPSNYQIDAYDDTSSRLTNGTVGFVTSLKGSKYFKDLVVSSKYHSLDYALPASWHDLTMHTYEQGIDADYLFKTVDLLDNMPHWVILPSDENNYYYPVLLHPISQTSLDFDGKLKYLAAKGFGEVITGRFALEAWVCPSFIKESSIVSSAGQDANGKSIVLAFGMDSLGNLKLSQRHDGSITVLAFSQGTVLQSGRFCHVAVSTKDDGLAFFINGAEVSSSVQTLGLLDSSKLIIERIDIGRGMDIDYFLGQIKEVRIWNKDRGLEDIRLSMYQKAASSGNLIGYWSLGEDDSVLVRDLSGKGNDMRKGGLVEDRRPLFIEAMLFGFWRPQRNALNFNGTSHVIKYAYDRADADVCRCTIEVWFRVEDKSVSAQKQVIYQEGNDQCGLAIYVFDSALYVGGYNLSCGWGGTWISSDRIESGRWHHAALVLDGRAELRDQSIQVYLDGMLMGSGCATKIVGPNVSFSLGGLHNKILFEDGLYDGVSGQFLRGQVLCLRIWKTAHTDEQIRSNLYSEPKSTQIKQMNKAELVHWKLDHADCTWEPELCENVLHFRQIQDSDLPSLDLWWESNNVDITAHLIIDQSGKNRNVEYSAEQLQAIILPEDYVLPEVSLDEQALEGIAIIKLLLNRHFLAIDRLAALWYCIEHTGYDEGRIPLYDRLFNPKGTVLQPWDYYQDEPMRWDKSGQEDHRRDGEIRSRLMGALRLSDSDLNLIVSYLSGKDENIIEIDNEYIGRLYQLSLLSKMVGLSVADLLDLLNLLGEGRPESLLDVLKISDVAAWLDSSGLGVSDLVYFACDFNDPENAKKYLNVDDIRTLAKNAFGQSSTFLLSRKSFQSDHVTEAQSGQIFDLLSGLGIITSIGAASQKYSDDVDLTSLLSDLAREENWISEFDQLKAEFDQISAGLGDEIMGRLQSHAFVDSLGLVLEKENGYGTESLMEIFDGASPSQAVKDKLPRVTQVLEERKAFQDMLMSVDGPICTALKSSQETQKNVLFSELAEVFDVQVEIVSPIMDYLKSSDNQDFDQILIDLKFCQDEGSVLPDNLEVELFKIDKLIYLANTFSLTAEEVDLLSSHPERYSVSGLLRPSFSDLNNLANYKQLQLAFSDTEGKLDELLALSSDDVSAIKEALYDLADWPPDQQDSLATWLGLDLLPCQYGSIPGLHRFKECFDIVALMKTGIGQLVQLADTSKLGTVNEYGFYSEEASKLLETFRSAYSEEEWPDKIKPIHDYLAVLRRDALLALALQKLPDYWDEYAFCWDDVIIADPAEEDIDQLKIFLGRTLGLAFVEDAAVAYVNNILQVGLDDGENVKIAITKDATGTADGTATLTGSEGLSLELIVKLESQGINKVVNIYRRNQFRKDPNIYYEYFLMDLQAGPEIETSSIVQATAALQLYIQRCQMNLEAGVNPSTIPSVEWEWVKNYRVWEANRKVFLYPENYIEPDLRDSKTSFFEDLENELLQSSFSDEAVENAYLHYLEKFAEIANLKIVGSYRHVVNDSDDNLYTLYLVGKMEADPNIFYLRMHIRDESGERWLPWEKIDLTINSNFVTPVYAFGRLFLFWTEFIKLKKGVAGSDTPEEYYQPSIRYSYFNFTGEWKAPQSWVELQNVQLSEEEHQEIRWQRMYAQRILNLSLPENASQEWVENNAMVLKIDSETFIEKTIPKYNMATLTWEFWVKFENTNTSGWLGSVAKDDCIQTCTLVNYGYGSFEADAKNKVVEVPGYQDKVDDAAAAKIWTQDALNEIGNTNYLSIDFAKVAYFEANAKTIANGAEFDEHAQVAAAAEAAEIAANDANQEKTNAIEARNTAITERNTYNNMLEVNLLHPGTYTDQEIADQLKKAKDAEDDADDAEDDAAASAQIAKTKATDAYNAADHALQVELAKPKWVSENVIISLIVSNVAPNPAIEIPVAFNAWSHIAIVMRTVTGKYYITIYENGELVFDQSNVGASPLTAEATIIVGKQEGTVQNAFVARMSELRLWSLERSLSEITDNMSNRMSMVDGLFSLPLNETDPSCNMKTEASELSFTHLPLNGVLARIAARERLILFFGDKIASLRNNLKDKGFTLVLEPNWNQVILDVNLSYDARVSGSSKALLHIIYTNGVSINDFATSDTEILARPATLPAKYVDESKLMLQNLEGTECLFFDVNNQPGWYIVNSGDEQFLVKMIITDQDTGEELFIPPTSKIMKVDYGSASVNSGDPQELVVSFELDDDNPILAQTSLIISRDTGISRTVAVALSPVGKNAICAEDPSNLYGDTIGKITKVDLVANKKSITYLDDRNYLYFYTGSRIAITLNADGRRTATIHSANYWNILDFDKKIYFTLWDCESGEILKNIKIDYEKFNSLMALSNNDTNPVVISAKNDDYQLVVWRTNESNVHFLAGHTNTVTGLALTPNGARAVSTSKDGTLRIWDIAALSCSMSITGHVYADADAVAISNDGQWAATVESGKKIRVWDLRDLPDVSYKDLPESHTEYITSLCIFDTANGLRVLSGSRDKTLKFWNAVDGSLIDTFSGHSEMVTAICARDNMAVSVSNDRTVKLWSLSEGAKEPRTIEFSFERLNTFAVHKLSENLFTDGIDGLLSLSSQKTPELDFWDTYDPNKDLVPEDRNPISKTIDFRGTYRLYYEEIFFHIPFQIANTLNSNQDFEEAQRWYHYIFNPTDSDETAASGSGKDRYWKYLPFKEDKFVSLKSLLADEEALAAYRNDPFDPHAIAALRLSAYKKAVVMKYIDNLLDWGDALFMQDSRESINEAVGLYVLAYNLLGPRPVGKEVKNLQETGTYEDFIADYESDSEFLTEVEKIAAGGTPAQPNPHRNIITDFCVPENAKFIGYWDLVEDRLYKIRHSQNIEGIYRQLALFSPPIEPSQLVAAVASGAGINGALAELNVAVPHYRYPIVVGLAKEMIGNTISLGSALLDAIEKRDAAKLEMLQNTHERVILDLTTKIRENEVDLTKRDIEELNISKERCINRRDHYQSLIDEGLIPAEESEIAFAVLEQVAKAGKSALEAIAAIASGTPTAEIGSAGLATPVLTTAWGGNHISEVLGHSSEVLDVLAELFELAAHVSEKCGEYERRNQEWQHELKTSNYDLREIESQISSARIKQDNAEKEFNMHLKTIEQNKDIAYFYKNRFSSEALYNWMVGKLSALYFQSYKTAYDMAKSAEKCLQYEIPSTTRYITPTHWDSLRKGLLAGEALLLQIDQMEKSHLAQDSRFIEIERTISMKEAFPGSLLLLMAKGACEFQLKEALFDRDYPGHYFRVIKTIELTVITEADLSLYPDLEEYKPVNVTLIQLGNKALLTPDINGVKYLMGLDGSEEPDSSTVRVNWRANQQVAVSRVNQRDAGMFIMDFIFDNRYFPFEGTGLISSWRLEIPLSSNPALLTTVQNISALNISDVLIHIRYTAKSDRGKFKTEVEKLLK